MVWLAGWPRRIDAVAAASLSGGERPDRAGQIVCGRGEPGLEAGITKPRQHIRAKWPCSLTPSLHRSPTTCRPVHERRAPPFADLNLVTAHVIFPSRQRGPRRRDSGIRGPLPPDLGRNGSEWRVLAVPQWADFAEREQGGIEGCFHVKSAAGQRALRQPARCSPTKSFVRMSGFLCRRQPTQAASCTSVQRTEESVGAQPLPVAIPEEGDGRAIVRRGLASPRRIDERPFEPVPASPAGRPAHCRGANYAVRFR